MANQDASTIDTIAIVLKTLGKKAAQAIVDGLTGPLRDKAAAQVAAYKGTDQGDASSLSVQSGADGTVRPTNQETFAGRPAAIPRDDPNAEGTFGAGFTPIETERSTDDITGSGTQKKNVSKYTRSTVLKDPEGNQLTEQGLSDLSDADITERYTVFFGEKPKDVKTARSEFLDLFKSFSTTANPLLD